MKKIIGALVIIALIAGGCFAFWKYFNMNYKEYEKFYEVEVKEDDELCFLDEMLVRISGDEVDIFKVTDDYFGEIYGKTCVSPEIVFSSDDFFVLKDGSDYNVYYQYDEKLTYTLLPSQNIRSIHQYGDALCVKTIDASGRTKIFLISKLGLIKNISVDYDFVDYCRDPVNNNEYFISYELSGEYVKLVIKKYDGTKETGYIAIDDFVYNDIDCIGDMIVFYTDTSMVFVNTKTSVRRTQNYYDINGLTKFIYPDKIVYYAKDSYINGVNNLLVVENDVSLSRDLSCDVGLCKFNDKLLFLENDCVKMYQWGDSLIDDSILFTTENARSIYAMDGIIAVVKDDRVEFNKVIK